MVLLFQIINRFRVYFSFPSKGKGEERNVAYLDLVYCNTLATLTHMFVK
jgi:hypothetical protein